MLLISRPKIVGIEGKIEEDFCVTYIIFYGKVIFSRKIEEI